MKSSRETRGNELRSIMYPGKTMKSGMDVLRDAFLGWAPELVCFHDYYPSREEI
jgi:hypothetical protein